VETLPESTDPHSNPDPTSPERWELLRDVVVFQLKLLLDALRDVVLSPVSLLAGAIDLFGRNSGDVSNFHRVLDFGRATDQWIDLFGSSRSEPLPVADEPTFDRLVAQVESLIVDEYERGGITASAKDAIDRSIDRISRNRRS
jgi:hypothetical protein